MTSDEAVESVIGALEQSGIPYTIVGSFASNYYGIARSTKDAVILISSANIRSKNYAIG